MKLHLDSSKGYYSSRVGLNMYPLTTGEYKVVFELYFPSVSINRSTVQISAISNTETVTRISTNTLSNHSRSVTHRYKYNNVTPNYPLIDIVLKIKLASLMPKTCNYFLLCMVLKGTKMMCRPEYGIKFMNYEMTLLNFKLR